jgi:hypothetical protein
MDEAITKALHLPIFQAALSLAAESISDAVTHRTLHPSEIRVILLMRKHLKELNFIENPPTNPDDIQCTHFGVMFCRI